MFRLRNKKTFIHNINLSGCLSKAGVICFLFTVELAPGTIRLTGDRAKGDDSKQNLHCINESLVSKQQCLLSLLFTSLVSCITNEHAECWPELGWKLSSSTGCTSPTSITAYTTH